MASCSLSDYDSFWAYLKYCLFYTQPHQEEVSSHLNEILKSMKSICTPEAHTIVLVDTSAISWNQFNLLKKGLEMMQSNVSNFGFKKYVCQQNNSDIVGLITNGVTISDQLTEYKNKFIDFLFKTCYRVTSEIFNEDFWPEIKDMDYLHDYRIAAKFLTSGFSADFNNTKVCLSNNFREVISSLLESDEFAKYRSALQFDRLNFLK